jgi:hypothetical protein
MGNVALQEVRSRLKTIILLIVVVAQLQAIAFVSANQGVQSARGSMTTTYTSGQIVWSANFETGDNSQFNAGQSSTCLNGVIGVSSSIVHSGNYAGYYSGQMPVGQVSCREHPLEALPNLTDFHWEMWVYVPTQNQTDWLSFATFNTVPKGPPFTLDASTIKSTPEGLIDIDITRTNPSTYVWSNVTFPYNAWFKLSLDAHAVDTTQGNLTVYLNDAPIIHYQGQLLSGPFNHCHFGAYFGGNQSSWTVYNDDIVVEALSGGGGTTTSSTTTSTSDTTTTSTRSGTVNMMVSDAVLGGGNPMPPSFNYVLNGESKSVTLSRIVRTVTVDAGSQWSVTPNPLDGSSFQRWYSTQPLTGTASATTIDFVYEHQYFLTMRGTGTISPSSGWYDAGAKVTITATGNSGHKFKSWTGTGTGSYTGTSPSHTIVMQSAITETANFT